MPFMKPSFSPERVVPKAESFLMKRTPLAVISFTNNEYILIILKISLTAIAKAQRQRQANLPLYANE